MSGTGPTPTLDPQTQPCARLHAMQPSSRWSPRIALLAALLSVSTFVLVGANQSRPIIKVALIVESPSDELRQLLESHVRRELRQFSDVDIVQKYESPRLTVHLICSALEDKSFSQWPVFFIAVTVQSHNNIASMAKSLKERHKDDVVLSRFLQQLVNRGDKTDFIDPPSLYWGPPKQLKEVMTRLVVDIDRGYLEAVRNTK